MVQRIPNSAATVSLSKKKPSTEGDVNFDKFLPAWRIGKFDYSYRWGLKALLGEFEFHLNDTIIEKVLVTNDESLFDALSDLDRKSFSSIDEFWKALSNKYQADLPSTILEDISRALVREGFQTKVFPKLVSYESNTWSEILSYTHRKGNSAVTNNHSVSVANLCKEARKRLEDLKYNIDELFSLRLEGTIRIYGFRVHNYLEILWIDLNHEVYPPK